MESNMDNFAKPSKKRKRKRPVKHPEENAMEKEFVSYSSEEEDDIPSSDSEEKEMEIDYTKLFNLQGQEVEQITLDINYVDPSEQYFHAIRYFLINLLDNHQYNVGDLCSMIIKQVCIGTLVVSDNSMNEEDNDLFALISLLSLKLYKTHDSIKSIYNYVIAQAKNKLKEDQYTTFINIFKTKNVGLLINERLINLAPRAIPPLHQNLLDDITWTSEQPDIESSLFYSYDFVLYLTKATREKKNSKSAKKIKTHSSLEMSDFVYYKFEDDSIIKNSEITFSFTTSSSGKQSEMNSNQENMTQDVIYEKIISLIPFEKYKAVVQNFSTQIQ